MSHSIKPASGFTLVELIIAMVVLGVAIAGLANMFSVTSRTTTDPIRLQRITAAALALTSEIRNLPMFVCDPGDASFSTATKPGDCASSASEQTTNLTGNCQNNDTTGFVIKGPFPNTESRGGTDRFDVVTDFGGYTATDNLPDILGIAQPDLSAAVEICDYSAGSPFSRNTGIQPPTRGELVRIIVNVWQTNNPNVSVRLVSYRSRQI